MSLLVLKSNTAFDSLENRERLLFAELFKLDNENLMMQVGKLKPKVRKALELRYGLNDGTLRTYDQIGKILDVSSERVRQIIIQGLSALRRWQRSRTYCAGTYKWLSPAEIEEHMNKYQDLD